MTKTRQFPKLQVHAGMFYLWYVMRQL